MTQGEQKKPGMPSGQHADAQSDLPSAERAEGRPDDIDELTDRLSETRTPEAVAEAGSGEPSAELAEDTVLEEERVKDEIEIQIDLLQDQDWVVRREAVVTLGEMGDERCVQPLVRALHDGDWQVREAAVESLGMIGSPAVEPLLKQIRNWDVRKFVLRALGKMKDERVLEPLIGQLRSDEFKEDATEALTELGKPAVGHLVAALHDKDENIRKQAVIILGRIQDPDAIDPLITMLAHPDWFTRLTAAAALEKIGDERGREAIKLLLKDPDLVVKMRVERILAGWKKRAAHA
jgi:HEAT repeat protein